MTPTATRSHAVSFSRRKVVRAASGVASFGVLAGLALVGAAPAGAADACTDENTVIANALGTNSAAIQALLTASTGTICLSGTFNLTADLTFDYDVTLLGLNAAVLDGGGIHHILWNPSGTHDVTVQNLTFSNGHAEGATFAGDVGGAISAREVTAIDSFFIGNFSYFAGAIYGETVTVSGSTFVSNTGGYFGGAVGAGQSLTVTDSTFTSNSASAGMGGALGSYGVLNVSGSTFEDNTSVYEGGAAVAMGVADVENSTFVGNSATTGYLGRGGALAVGAGTILQNTFVNNVADVESGGNAVFKLTGDTSSVSEAATGPLDLRGNIFASDLGEVPQVGTGGGGPLNDLGGNVFSTLAATETAVTAGPNTKFGIPGSALFSTGLLADNGGPTQTLALSATSPALGNVPAGDPAVATDQRGVARTTLADSGAFQLSTPALAATGLVPNNLLAGGAAAFLAFGALAIALRRRFAR